MACNNSNSPGLDLLVNCVRAIAFPVSEWIALLFAAPGGDESAGEPEVQWLARVGDGDESALQLLFDRWKLPLLSFFYRSLGSRADAEDLTLEVFVRLHRNAASYRHDARFTTFLFRIARNLLLNELRRRRRKPAQASPPEEFDYLAAGETDSPRRLAELEEVFQLALARLPEKYRTPLLLLKQQQLDYPSIAATLGTSENGLRVLIHRARQMLKAEMEAIT